MTQNTNNEEVLEKALAEIMRSAGGNPPPILDPFCGGGSIPLEVQRLVLAFQGGGEEGVGRADRRSREKDGAVRGARG